MRHIAVARWRAIFYTLRGQDPGRLLLNGERLALATACGSFTGAAVCWVLPQLPVAHLAAVMGACGLLSLGVVSRVIRDAPVGERAAATPAPHGRLVRAINGYDRGIVQFREPVQGSTQWVCRADTPIPAGTLVRVLDSRERHVLRVEAVPADARPAQA